MIFEFNEIRLLCLNHWSLGRHHLHRVHFLHGLHHPHRLLIFRFLRFEVHLPHHFFFPHHLILLHDILQCVMHQYVMSLYYYYVPKSMDISDPWASSDPYLRCFLDYLWNLCTVYKATRETE